MKIFKTFLIVLGLFFIVSSSDTVNAQSLPACGQGQANGLADWDIDHYDLVCFANIPDSYITLARNMDFLWIDRSVGINIHDGLNCMASGTPYASASSACKNGLTEAEYISDTKYNRSNWDVAHYGDGGWYDNIENYIRNEEMTDPNRAPFAPNYASYDAISFQFSYLSVMEGSDIISPTSGFFVNNASLYRDVFDMQTFEAGYPNASFIYATTSLARIIGTSASQNFNNMMRSHSIQNSIPLLDFADIGSSDPNGNPCYNGQYLALCANYTTEPQGGHLNPVGKLRASKAMWLMMASLAGWRPTGGGNTPTPTRVATPTFTPTPSPTRTPTVTPVPIPGDANGDGRVNGADYIIWLTNYNSALTGSRYGDFNNSGRVEGVDYVIWLRNFTP